MPASSSIPANRWYALMQSRLVGCSPKAALYLHRTIKEMVVRYDAGEDTSALRREYGISRTDLCNLLGSEASPKRGQVNQLDGAEIAVQLFQNGLTISASVCRRCCSVILGNQSNGLLDVWSE